jgi:hypothetical protein
MRAKEMCLVLYRFFSWFFTLNLYYFYMSSNLSTEATGPASSSGNVGTGTVGELKTDFANLLINRVTLGECLNVIRDACVARAADIVDEADEPTLANIRKDVISFQEAGSAGSAGSAGDTGSAGVDSSAATGPVSGPVAWDGTGNIDDWARENEPAWDGVSVVNEEQASALYKARANATSDATGSVEDGSAGNAGGPTGP